MAAAAVFKNRQIAIFPQLIATKFGTVTLFAPLERSQF